jgi:non-ribosomal peptide synthetase component F
LSFNIAPAGTHTSLLPLLVLSLLLCPAGLTAKSLVSYHLCLQPFKIQLASTTACLTCCPLQASLPTLAGLFLPVPAGAHTSNRPVFCPCCLPAGLTAYIAWLHSHFGINPGNVFLQKTPTNFDASVDELWAALAAGATLVVVPPEAHRDVHSVMELITR